MAKHHEARSKNAHGSLLARSAVSSAVVVALYGVAPAALAQQAAPQSTGGALAEIVVTATRRSQSLEEVPYSLSVVSAEDLARTGVTDIASLANQVPGLSLYDFGARLNAATTPIIRGLNGTGESADRPFRSFEQSPVGTYIGNSPIDGYFQLDDVQRIEVLRGPQGTLYGAGALGGALRVIPNSPELGSFSARLDTSAGTISHSSGVAYTAGGVLNVPLGETLAFRASGKFDYEPGFIDVFGIVKRSGSALYGAPVLADPSDPVNSSAIYSGRKDWNDQNTFTGRASLLWKPNDKFDAELAFIYSDLNGNGGPQTNTSFKGGPYFIDPRITFPAGGDYMDLQSFNQPFWRKTTLASLDLSFDAGFATLSSTSSYATTPDPGRGHIRRGRVPVLQRVLFGQPAQSAIRVRPGIRRFRAHVYGGAAHRLQEYARHKGRLRRRRILREARNLWPLAHIDARLLRALRGSGLHPTVRLPRHLPKLPVVDRTE